jgi:hypothetical protein
MQLNARQFVMQFAHLAQQDLFPHLETAVGPLTPRLKLLASVVSLLPLGRLLDGQARRHGTSFQGSHRLGDRIHRQGDFESAEYP